jgi:hypothetical protein
MCVPVMTESRMCRITSPKSVLLLTILGLGACADDVTLSSESIGRVVRDVGYPCGGAVDAKALDASKETWRVACASADTYLAAVQANGELCVEPLPLGDGGPAPPVLPPVQPRCATP